jgi:hypothetical protein
MPAHPRIVAYVAAGLAACAQPPPASASAAPAALPAAAGPGPALAEELLLAPASTWHEVLPRVVAAGPAMVEPLIAAARAGATAPGRQAVIAALGALGDRRACPALGEWLAGGGPDAAEAALAAGRLGCGELAPALERVLQDRAQPIRNRTTAAAALLDLGHWRQAAPFLAAVLLADTAWAGQRATVFHLPAKARWAEERHVAIAAIARACGGETFGLDPDAAHPQLARGVAAFERALAERAR